MAVQVAASSSHDFTSKTKYRYDVFLSFRGEDTRHIFTVPLYNALRRKGINAFIDDKKLGKGEEISPSLLKAIERSRVSIIVFSKNYATSTWCLEELAHIIQCKKEKNQLVMPTFYSGSDGLHEILKISYDCLPDDAKPIFLDISCFFKNERLEFVEDILGACYSGTRFYIEILAEKSLITIADNGCLLMHDLIQQMGKEIVNLEAPLNPGKRSRLWYYKDVLNVLHKNLKFDCVTYMNLSQCEFIREVPDMSHLKNLKTSNFRECRNLIKVHDSVGSLCKLIRLDVSECTKLTSFPSEIKMESLQVFDLSNCKSLDYFPHIVGKMDALTTLYAEGTAIKELPPSNGNLSGLEDLNISSCKSLTKFQNSLLTLQNLNTLVLEGSQPRVLLPSKNLSRLKLSFPCSTSSRCFLLQKEKDGAKNLLSKGVDMPATTFPDWFDCCCKGGTLSLRIHGKNFPDLVVAFESGKAKTIKSLLFHVLKRINSRKMQWLQSDVPYVPDASREGCVFVLFGKQGHVYSFYLLQNFSEEELEGLHRFLELDWNDVDIHVTCLQHDVSIVNCGIYVDKQQITNMENIHFVSPRLFPMNASRNLLKRKAIASPLNESAKKLLRNF
ncbi:hypothetical protein K1719_041317 [Acacia pycnantha]|nr:hypothetical protein K1719_041317 [Acacia pycnantha]